MGCAPMSASLHNPENKPIIVKVQKNNDQQQPPKKKVSNKEQPADLPKKKNQEKQTPTKQAQSSLKNNTAAASKSKKVKFEGGGASQELEHDNAPTQASQKKAKVRAEDKELLKEMDSTLKGDRVKAGKNHKIESKGKVQDAESQKFFEIEDVGHGDEFMAVLPWKGAIKEPNNHPQPNPEPPEQSYQIEYVYGYKSEEARQNCFYNSKNKPVYMTAALGVILDPLIKQQKIFGGGETGEMTRKQLDETMNAHTDDIMALCINQERTMVATGQVGLAPIIFVWDAVTAEKLKMMRLPKGSRSVTAIGFNKDATMLAAADFHNDHNVFVFNVESQTIIFQEKSGPDKIFMLHWSLALDNFCTVGPKTVYFWNPTGGKTAKDCKKQGTFGGTDKQTNLVCVTSDEKGIFYTGGQNGAIYKWQGNSMRSMHPTHKSVIHSIRYVNNQKENMQLLLSGGSDNIVNISNPEAMTIIKSITFESIPRSLDYGKKLLVGLRDGTILEYDVQTNVMLEIMVSHHDGEAWGLCTVKGTPNFYSSGDDNKILYYDIENRMCQVKGVIIQEDAKVAAAKKAAPPKTGYIGGASSTSDEPPEKQARAIAYNTKYKHLAVANNLGLLTIRDASNEEGDVNQIIATIKDSKEWIECMAYSPSEDMLAVGSHDNWIYIYSVKKGAYSKYAGPLKAHSSFITCLDWSLDGSYIRTNCGAYELLFFNVANRKQDSGGASGTMSTEWASQHCKLGWSVQGIFPPGCDGTHINGVDMSEDQQLIATGDDYGLVNIYRNPALENHKARSFRGHSEHVTRVLFTMDDQYLISIGGLDQTVIQWKRVD